VKKAKASNGKTTDPDDYFVDKSMDEEVDSDPADSDYGQPVESDSDETDEP